MAQPRGVYSHLIQLEASETSKDKTLKLVINYSRGNDSLVAIGCEEVWLEFS